MFMHDHEAKAKARLESGDTEKSTPGGAGQEKHQSKLSKADRKAM